VKRSLRYVLEDKFGLDSNDYAWWYQAEPHPGDGANAGYLHAHPVVVFDRAKATVDSVVPEDFRSVVDKHIELCPGADWSAHDLDDSVVVKEPGEIEDFAQYVSEYVAVSPDEDLLQRSDEYLMFAAANWASTSQKYSKSATATAAIDADKCHQQYADPNTNQDHDHGEELTRRDGELVCWNCGHSFGIEQNGTLVERRVSTDGGAPSDDSSIDESSRTLGDLWKDARAAGSVGSETVVRECDHPDGSNECPLCAESKDSVPSHVPIPDDAEPAEEPEATTGGFGRHPPQWRPDAIVRKSTDEETPIGSPGGTQYAEVILPGVGSISYKLDRTLLPEWLEGPAPWENSPVTEDEVRSGEVPPPELVQQEYTELHNAGVSPGTGNWREFVTEKEWADDWYAERFEREDTSTEEATSESELDGVREYVRSNSDVTVPELMGRFSLHPSYRPAVKNILKRN
jgi:hypothetical protein